MRVRLLFFAGLREAIGKKEHGLELDAHATIGEALARAEELFPVLVPYRGRLVVSRNEERADPSIVLDPGDELALLPPMSGGSAGAQLLSSPLSLDALLAEVVAPGRGGIVTFIGTVRDHAKGKSVERLEYEAYVPMAEKEMRKIADEVRARWPGAEIAMSHRIGRLEIGAAAVMIAVAAPHRAEAFDACRFAIDTLKRTVPIWKKEFAEDGTHWVEGNP